MSVGSEQLDLNLIVERIQRHKDGYDVVTGKDIVFFIGNTGSGKTTTILYLAGKELKEVTQKLMYEEDEIEDLVLCCADAMPGFVIGHRAQSETIAANSYDCQLSGLTYVDFAGQVDTQGPEIEIANTVGLFNTVSRARSVRLVLVVDYESIETLKGQIFKKSLEFVSGFVPNLNEKFDSMTVLFTHTKNARVPQLKVKFSRLKQAVPQGEVSEFLDHMYKTVNVHGASLMVEPTEPEKCKPIIEILRASTPLETHADTFHFYLPHEIRVLVVERLKGVLAVVQEYLCSYSWTKVKQLLDDLHLLKTEMSMMVEIVEIYDSAVSSAIKAAQELVASIHAKVNSHDYKAAGSQLDLLMGASQLQYHIQPGINITISYKDIQEIINTQMLSSEKYIENTESYMLVKQQFDLVNSITTHLSTHLTDNNKALAAKLEHLLQERVTQQYTNVMSMINSLSKGGDSFVEAKDKYLVDLLAHDLGLMSKVTILFEGSTHYHDVTSALNMVITYHGRKFLKEISIEPVSEELQLSFKVLKDFNKSFHLVAHASIEVQAVYHNAETAFTNLLGELNKSVGEHSVKYDFAPIAQITSRIHALVKIDQEFCMQFTSEKFTQSILQMQTCVAKLLNKVQKKMNEEIFTIDGCKFIREKVAVLEQAKKIERNFSDPTMVSLFLTQLHGAFLAKANKLLNILEETLVTATFSDSPQAKEICIILEVGIIPEAVQQFQAWTTKFQNIIQTTELQMKQHTAYPDLVADLHHLNNLQQFNTAFLMSGQAVFNTITSSIKVTTDYITEKIKNDWREYHGKFLDMVKQVSPQLNPTQQGHLKDNIIELIQKLKDINDTCMEIHLGDLKPSVELSMIVKNLRSHLNTIESDTRTKIAVGHLDSAEKNIIVIDLLCSVLNCIDIVDNMPFSTLSSTLLEKRLNLVQQIPEKLQRNAFNQVATILKDMKDSIGAVERKEFENICIIITVYFTDLYNTVRCTTPESVHAAINVLQIFNKAAILDTLELKFNIDKTQNEIVTKINAYITKSNWQFKKLLEDYRFVDAWVYVEVFEEFSTQYPDINAFKSVKFQDDIETCIKDLPKAVTEILKNLKWSNISRIDKFIDQLELVRYKLKVNVTDIISEIESYVITVAKQKDNNITDFFAQFNLNKAEEELDYLSILTGLKHITNFKVKEIVKKRKEDLESIRQSQFSWNSWHQNPSILSENLFIIKRDSYAEYNKLLKSIDTQCNELSTSINEKLENISKLNSTIILKPLADELKCYTNIVNAFAKHKDFSNRLNEILKKKLLTKLHSTCKNLQSDVYKAIKATQWGTAEGTLKLMQAIKNELNSFVDLEFTQSIITIETQLKQKVETITKCIEFFKGLDFFVQFNIDLLTENLASLKDNASTVTQVEFIPTFKSYEDVITTILDNIIQNEENVKKELWKEKKYEKIVCFLQNMQKGYKFAKHPTLVTGLSEHCSNLINFILEHVMQLKEQAEKAYKDEDLLQLEEIQKKYTEIYMQFREFSEIFPNGKNEMVETLEAAITYQIQDFKTRFVTSKELPSIEQVIVVLLKLKTFSSTISNTSLAPHVHTEMNNLLNFLLTKKNFDFFKLGSDLCNSGTFGRDIVEGDNFPQFKAVVITLMNKIIARITPDDALKMLAAKNKWANTTRLQYLFNNFNQKFKELLPKYLISSSNLDTLVKTTKVNFNKNIKDSLPENLAAIFVVWSVSTSKAFYQDSKSMETVLHPHPIQVLTILCMLELDSHWSLSKNSTTKIKGHLVQIGTGEGKSVILGILATVLALLGFEVSCACYSSYLSERDYLTFLDIFTRFGVDTLIRYSTLAQLAGGFINEQGDIRNFTNQFIEGASWSRKPKQAERPRILLIDEVDTFLSKDFYGATYNPSTILHNENVNSVLEYIWKHQDCAIADVQQLEGYKQLIVKYKEISVIIEGAVQRMIYEVKNVNNPPYFCVKNKLGQMVVGYKENGTVSTSIQHGYRTCFAYLQARDVGEVTNEITQQNLGLAINCGQFSYAEIPKEYKCILGVTGTLETLCSFEKKIKNETYKIENETYTPSIYGDSRLTFRHVEDVFVMSDTTNYHLKLIDMITNRQKAQQPVLVFFESELELNIFADSEYCQGQAFNVIKENTENIDFYIRKATRINEATGIPEVTLLPRVFGRGLDFACRDDRVNPDRGVHVIQAFLSEDVSEEIQIKGRTARQGKPGTYCLIINQKDLTKQFAITPKQVEDKRNTSKLYEFLHTTRVTQFEKKSNDRNGIVERSFQAHTESLKFRSLFLQKREAVSADIVRFLEAQNPKIKPRSRIMCLSDATGSMSSVWDNAKAQIVEMVNRIIAIGGAGKSELMWVAYRDYSDVNKLESSGWSHKPAVLCDFINKIKCTGGGDTPEAVELGLAHANAMTEVTRVILIGDACPHLEPKGTNLEFHNIVMNTDYREESALLATKKIPVYCFYMNETPALVKSFQEIASITGGKASLFSNAATLIDIIAECVLDDIGGEQMVLEYRQTYHS